MKTIKDIITGKKNLTSGREYLSSKYIKDLDVTLNKILVLTNSLRETDGSNHLTQGSLVKSRVYYFYTYSTTEGRRKESKMFISMDKMIEDMKQKTHSAKWETEWVDS